MIWLLITVVIVSKPIIVAGSEFIRPPMREHIKPVISYVQERRKMMDEVSYYSSKEEGNVLIMIKHIG